MKINNKIRQRKNTPLKNEYYSRVADDVEQKWFCMKVFHWTLMMLWKSIYTYTNKISQNTTDLNIYTNVCIYERPQAKTNS